jgi:hypothetical protein
MRSAVCHKFLTHLRPLEDRAAYWCDGCQETVTLELLLASAHRDKNQHPHQPLWPARKPNPPDPPAPKVYSIEERRALRGAVSIPDESAGGLSLAPEEDR